MRDCQKETQQKFLQVTKDSQPFTEQDASVSFQHSLYSWEEALPHHWDLKLYEVSSEFITFHWIYRYICENENFDHKLKLILTCTIGNVTDMISLLQAMPGFTE